MSMQGRYLAMMAGLMVGFAVSASSWGAERPAGRVPGAKEAVEPLAPKLPEEIVAALQGGRFEEAVPALTKLADDPKADPEDRAYYELVRGVALRLDKKFGEARDALQAGLDHAPEGRWAVKLRSELAAVALAEGRFADAEKIARADAERLLAGDRKDRLAAVYQDFAQRLLEPDEPTTPADPEGAFALLAQARELAQGEELRAELLLEMGKASQKAGNHPRAIENFQQYVKEYPEGADRAEARFRLAESQLASGQTLPARLTWTDLARDLEETDTKEAQEQRGRALYQIAKTYNIPSPPNETSLDLGVAALKRLLEAYPDHPLAVKAAFEIGRSYMERGRSQASLEAFEAFLAGKGYQAGDTDEARRDEAEWLMAAQFHVAWILRWQGKYAEAIEAWKDYLAKYPNGPQSADSQKAILATQLLIAQEHLRLKRYDEARRVWGEFVAQNPLDGRVPQVLFQVGASFLQEEKWDEAIKAWETLAGKFPKTEPAGHAQFEVARIFEVQKGEPVEAIERYKKIQVEPWASQARQRVAIMEAKALSVITPRTFRTGETPKLKIATRNLEKLTFTAYKLDAEAYFRKKQALENVEALDIGLVQPDAEWTIDVPGFEKYEPIDHEYALGKLEVPGVYVVKVTDEKNLQATTLVLGSDLDAIVKVSHEQVLVFAQDMKTGQGRAGARVLVSDGEKVVFEGKTGDDGVLLQDWKDPRQPGAALDYLVLDEGHVAGSGLGVPQQVAQGLSARAYLYSDRPAYRPGQTVELRGVVREIKEGRYEDPSGVAYKLEVFDSRGRQFFRKSVTLSEFGTLHASVPVDSSAPVGTYRIRLYRPNGSEFAGSFEVQAYQLQKVDLDFDLPQTVYFRGMTIEGDVIARYQYGTPLANRPIHVVLPDGRTLQGQTDAAGKYHFTMPTEGFAEEQALRLVAQLPQDGVAAAAQVQLAVRAFRIALETSREVYLDGESFPVQVRTIDALGEPTGQELVVKVLKRIEQGGRTTEREVKQEKVRTDEKTGAASVPIRIDDEQGGIFVLRASGTDRFGNPVIEEQLLAISGKEDAVKLRLLADRLTFKVGETANIKLHSRVEPGTALLTWEADRILRYKIVPIEQGDNAISWEVAGDQFPNFTLTAARMAGTAFHEARLNVRVERDLRVTIKPTKPAVGPGEEVEVEVITRDQLDRPVKAEVSLALVDQALLRLYQDNLPPIDQFFYNQTRTGAFETEATNTFHYEPNTTPVSEAVVEEMEQQLALRKDEMRFNKLPERAGQKGQGVVIQNGASQVFIDKMAPPMNTPAAVGGGGLGGQASSRTLQFGMGASQMGGGMGGMPGTAPVPPIRAATSGFAAEAPKEGMGSPDAAGPGMGMAGMIMGGMGDQRGMADLAAGAQAGRRAGRIGTGRAEPAATPAPRQQYVETAYWNPSVVTGEDGKAIVKFQAPSALSEYQFTARGVTGAETLVGQSEAELAVRQDFFVDLKLPTILNEGDKPRFAAELHHQGIQGDARVTLKLYAGGQERTLPKDVTLKGDGVEEILFDPFEVPAGDVVRLTLEAQAGESSDTLIQEIPIRPWGVQAFATASGTSKDDTTVFVGLPPGRPYESPELIVVVSPTLRRLVVELALGQSYYILDRRIATCILPPTPDTTADRASDLLALTSALKYVRNVGGSEAPEASRLAEKIGGLVAELVTTQNDDGGWPWVAPEPDKTVPSDRLTTATATWALQDAAGLGLMAEPQTLDKAANYLTQEFAKVESGDHDTRAAILHALSTRGKASFEQANSLNRLRQNLSDAALAYLALTFANLDRDSLAVEVLGVLGPRAKSEAVAPGVTPPKYWEGRNQNPWLRSATETTGLAALAFARSKPDDAVLAPAIDWLLAHRIGTGWVPHKAKGPAVAALAGFHGQAEAAVDNFTLVVTVNEQEVGRYEVKGQAQGEAIRVPLKHVKAAGQNRIHFDLEGRGTFGYAATLTGFTRDFRPDQDRAGRPFMIDRRVYLAAEPEFEGKTLPTGFGVAVNAKYFENKVSQVVLGGRTRVMVEASRYVDGHKPAWERDFLVVEEHLPAGATLVEGSVQSSAQHFEVGDGTITFYFAPDQWPGRIQYDLYGYLPGDYRALPTEIRSAYDPGRYHLGGEENLKILPPGQKSDDPYKATPDELYARGKALFDAGRFAEAAEPLEALWNAYNLRDDVAKDAARMLLKIHIKQYDPNKVVKYFEILREKAPELVIPFADIQVVGRSYADIGEHERAFLVWRATAEASYLEDARVGEVLRQRGKTLEGLAYLLDLWREYPSTASIQSDFFGLSQVLASLAGRAIEDTALRRELARAEVNRADLLAQEIALIRVFLSQSPRDPIADEASLALVGAFLELEDFEAVVKLSERFAKLYPKSRYLDSFQYSEALGHFHLNQADAAIELAETIAKATYKDENGVEQPSPNKWQALYILGQIHDAKHQPSKAVAYYEQVADRFSEAASAVKALTRKQLGLPEVAVVRPALEPEVAGGGGGVGLRNIDAAPRRAGEPDVKLESRNIAEVDVKVYAVDLLRLYLERRNLDGIAGIDLAGIHPLVEKTVKLGDGLDFDAKTSGLDLPLEKEGAYLVMARGEDLYASGIVLVSPLELEVLEEADAGRVRVRVLDARTKAFVPKVEVKVIGSENPTFFSGMTDLRGVFIAEGVRGQVTAVARKEATQYAFYRGQIHVGPPATPKAGAIPADAATGENPPAATATPAEAAKAPQEGATPGLDENLKSLNTSNQLRQLERLQQRYNNAAPSQGVQVDKAMDRPPAP